MKPAKKEALIEFVWKWRRGTALFVILVVQLIYVCVKIFMSLSPELLASIEALHVFLSSGLFFYMFSKYYDSLVERILYGSFRQNWQEVKVMYSPHSDSDPVVLRGTGKYYPREPTLLIHKSPFGTTDEHAKIDRKYGQLMISFNTAFKGDPGESTGMWSELQPIEIHIGGGYKVIYAGFPRTLT